MFDKMLEKMTGKDDLERVACKGDLDQLNACLKTRKVWIPRKPKSFLNADDFTQERLMELIRKDTKELSETPFEPWILEADGMKRLPAFSSKEKMRNFSNKISLEIGKIFALGYSEVLLEEITKNSDIDFVDLNLFSENSLEIGLRRRSD